MEKYNEVLERAKDAYKHCATDAEKKRLEFIFPELKESEDERIIKNIRIALMSMKDNLSDFYSTHHTSQKELLSWLEKQGEQNGTNFIEILKHYPRETELYSPLYGKLWLAEVDEKNEIITCYKHCLDEGCTRAILEQEDTVSFYSDGTTGLPDYNVSKDCMLFLYDITKQGEVLETNKIEPKFKVGDWIVGEEFICKVVDIRERFYKLYFVDGQTVNIDIPYADEKYRLWAIEDAKDGDVLAGHECYVIFKNIAGLNIRCHCTYHYMGYNPSLHVETLQNKTAFHPATNEQRDLLLQKIEDAGYEWDAKNKELRKQCNQESIVRACPKFRVGDWYGVIGARIVEDKKGNISGVM